jgi:hypothetical protein
MNNSPMEAELFHAGRQADRHDEANSRFSHFAKARKNRISTI